MKEEGDGDRGGGGGGGGMGAQDKGCVLQCLAAAIMSL